MFPPVPCVRPNIDFTWMQLDTGPTAFSSHRINVIRSIQTEVTGPFQYLWPCGCPRVGGGRARIMKVLSESIGSCTHDR